MKKRIISLLLAVMMLAGMMSVSAFAAFSYDENNVGGTGRIVIEAPEEVNVGAAFDVVVKIEEASAAALQYEVAYDSKLELVETTAADSYAEESFLASGDSGIWLTGDNVTGENPVLNGIANKTLTGKFVTLTFKATEVVESATITVSVLGGNADEKYVTFDDASASVKAVTPPYTLGDVNEDGWVDISDAVRVALYDAGSVDLTDSQLLAADVNLDGWVDISDAVRIALYDAGSIDSL